MDLSQKLIEPSPPSIQALFQTAQDCLDATSARHGHTGKACSELKRWREKTFDSAGSLDIVFESNKLACQPLRQCVLIILVRILFEEGTELGRISTSGSDKSADSSLYREVTAAISRIDKLLMSSMPSSSWSTRFDQPRVSKIRSTSTDSNPTDGLVEALHYLLPALNATRRFEKASVPNVEETGGEYCKYDEHCFAHSQQRFEDAEVILRKLDKTVGKKGEPGYALRLNQERVCLESINSLCKSREDMTTKTLNLIYKTQAPLRGELADFRIRAEFIVRCQIVKSMNKFQAKDHDKDNAERLISILHKMNRDLEDVLHKHDCSKNGKALESNSGTPYAQ